MVNQDELRAAVRQSDMMALQGARMLAMLPSYGIYNEVGMAEMRQAICAYLGVRITDEQATDARGWDAFIEPHIADLRRELLA